MCAVCCCDPDEKAEDVMDESHKQISTDLLVIGAGPGGYTAAFRAADLGLRTVLVDERATLGGVCLNVGCIPSKALLHAAHVVDEAEAFAEHGIRFGKPQIDLASLKKWKDSVVSKLTGGLSILAKQRKIDVIQGKGRLLSPNELLVDSGNDTRTVVFKTAIIAVGSRPARLSFLPEDSRIIDSTGALALESVPGRLLIIGGGIIGLEMATVYSALGSLVTVVELTEGLIPGCDRDLVKPLEKRLRKRLEHIYLGTKVSAVQANPDGLLVSFEGKEAHSTERFDAILVAVGRAPNGDRLDLQNAGIVSDAQGFIPVDAQQRTNVAHLFAIGDITGGSLLAHKASAEGKVAAEVAAGLKSGFENRVIPAVAYTDPEIAWVGVREDEAEAKGLAVGKGVFPWAASGRSLSLGRNEGMTKLLFDKATGRLIGAGIVGPGASELIAEATLAIEMGADARDVGLTIHPHPTLSESLALAAEVYDGTVTDLFVPKRNKPPEAVG
jgi:dihydrolipoamide dehydrogenase